MRKVRVKYNYGGAPSKERRILAGTYDEDDPALLGLADYLVRNGHAEYVEDEPDKAAQPPQDDWTYSAGAWQAADVEETLPEPLPRASKRRTKK